MDDGIKWLILRDTRSMQEGTINSISNVTNADLIRKTCMVNWVNLAWV
jgi:hypothetical protein